ncbi:MAG: DNA-3-methyladenine glycosylase [Chloroflexi bacterium]|nr:DNA-3-methyladenine glycosylase [Chloroflexota bacterium]
MIQPGLELDKLPPAFYTRPTLEIARCLLGKMLVCEGVGGLIVEVEGYVGQEDPACHASVGRTLRNEAMWGLPGHAYLYFTYGNHWMLNVVTEPEDYPAAVLIRAIQPIFGLELMRERRRLHLLKSKPDDRHLTNGPGKLCQALALTGELNGLSLQSERLFLAEAASGLALPSSEIVETTRIGITRGVDRPWRYYIKSNPFVSYPN